MFEIYTAKVKSKPLDIKNNLSQAFNEIENAISMGAKLVIFPQGFLTGVQLGILSDAIYFRELYNKTVLELTKKYPDIYILADIYTRNGFENKLYFNSEVLDADKFEIGELKFVSYNDINKLRDDARDIYADCIILNESSPVIAGSRHLTKKLLESIQLGTGATILANLGGYGFTSHPYVYLPSIICLCEDIDVFTTTLPEFIESKNLFRINKGKQGSRMLYNLPRLDFDITFNKNSLVPKQIDEKEYCLDLFHLQSVALADRLENINCKNAVIAISGGLDSALALLVTVNAFDLLNLDKSGIHCISMPGFGTSNTTKNLATELCSSLGLNLQMIDITASCTQALKDIGHDTVTADVTFENVQARMRTLHSLNLANSINGIMIGTGDLSEEALGFSTYGGDHLASYNINSCVAKTVIRTMLPYVIELDNIKSASKPITDILNIPVSPELIPHGGKILQKTEEILAPYTLIDFFIYCFIYVKLSPIEMAQKASCLFEGEFSPSYLREKAEMLCRRFITGQFKRSCAPESAITTHIHLRNIERSIPSDSSMGVFNYYFGK